MKRTSLMLLMVAFFTGSIYAQSGKLYVYETNGAEQEYAVSEVQKLIFTGDALEINKTEGEAVSVAYADLQYFSLIKRQNVALPLLGKAEINAYFDASGALIIQNATPGAAVALFNLQGQKLQQTTNCPAGVYVLQIADENGITTKKIIKK